jgi:hypothetical protein
MLGPAFEVSHTILFQLRFEPADPTPVGVLAAVVSEHLLGGTELAGGGPKDLDHRLGCWAAEQIGAHDEPGVIIHEGDEVGVSPAEPEGEDIRLPHLVGCGSLKEAWAGDVALLLGLLLGHQISLVQASAHGLRAGRHEEPASQPLADAFDPELGMLLAQLDDLVMDRLGQLVLSGGLPGRLQPGLAELLVDPDPAAEGTLRHAHLGTDIFQAEAFLQAEPDGPEPVGGGIDGSRFFAANPPRGVKGSLLPLLGNYDLLGHVNTPSNIGVSTN